MGGLFSQVAAFFASGIICSDEQVKDHLWWRQSEVAVLPLGEDGNGSMEGTLSFCGRWPCIRGRMRRSRE